MPRSPLAPEAARLVQRVGRSPKLPIAPPMLIKGLAAFGQAACSRSAADRAAFCTTDLCHEVRQRAN